MWLVVSYVSQACVYGIISISFRTFVPVSWERNSQRAAKLGIHSILGVGVHWSFRPVYPCVLHLKTSGEEYIGDWMTTAIITMFYTMVEVRKFHSPFPYHHSQPNSGARWTTSVSIVSLVGGRHVIIQHVNIIRSVIPNRRSSDGPEFHLAVPMQKVFLTRYLWEQWRIHLDSSLGKLHS